jgi:hypothetical protein
MSSGWFDGSGEASLAAAVDHKRLGRDGAARLLGELVRAGLAPDAFERAAALILCLDEDAAAEREAVAA